MRIQFAKPSNMLIILALLTFSRINAQITQDQISKLRSNAEKGDVKAQFFLGYALMTGNGMNIDYNEGIRWLQKASDNGNIESSRILGYFYMTGNGVDRDLFKAAKLFKSSAQRGDYKSQMYYGILLANGEGLKEDYVEAYAWIRLSKENSNNDDKEPANNFEKLEKALSSAPAIIAAGILRFNVLKLDPTSNKRHPNDNSKSYSQVSLAD